MGEFRMPSLGADMDVGTIVEWLVKPGDPVRRGQVVAVVDTAKAAMEIEAFESGVLERILVGVGTQVPVGTPLAVIAALGAEGGKTGEPAVEPVAEPAAGPAVEPVAGRAGVPAPEPALLASPPPAEARRRRRKPGQPRPGAAAGAVPDEVLRASPPVRHLAQQLGVDLATVAGSGPDGHVSHEDVLAAAAASGTVLAAAAHTTGTRLAGEPGLGSAAASVGAVPGGRLRATPRARRLAAERGIDLTAASGTGAGSAVLAADVERAARAHAVAQAAQAGPATEPAAPTTSPPTSGTPAAGQGEPVPTGRPAPRAADPDRRAAMRTAIATLMSRSNAEIPHYYVQQTVDLGPALAWLRAGNATLPAASRLLPAVLFLRATVLAAQAVPELNGHWVEGALRRADRVDLGVAVATRGGGLITPAIPDAGALGIHDLMARLADLVGRARRGTLKQAEMAGASITVSSLGETGPDALAGVIFPPQVALVGVGGIIERPWAVDGMLTVRPTVTITLAADHRASDGRTASAFLTAFAHALAHPEEL